MKNLLTALMVAFFVHVKVPVGIAKTYDNVKSALLMHGGFVWQLTLVNGKVVYVPALFAVIEEK